MQCWLKMQITEDEWKKVDSWWFMFMVVRFIDNCSCLMLMQFKFELPLQIVWSWLFSLKQYAVPILNNIIYNHCIRFTSTTRDRYHLMAILEEFLQYIRKWGIYVLRSDFQRFSYSVQQLHLLSLAGFQNRTVTWREWSVEWKTKLHACKPARSVQLIFGTVPCWFSGQSEIKTQSQFATSSCSSFANLYFHDRILSSEYMLSMITIVKQWRALSVHFTWMSPTTEIKAEY